MVLPFIGKFVTFIVFYVPGSVFFDGSCCTSFFLHMIVILLWCFVGVCFCVWMLFVSNSYIFFLALFLVFGIDVFFPLMPDFCFLQFAAALSCFLYCSLDSRLHLTAIFISLHRSHFIIIIVIFIWLISIIIIAVIILVITMVLIINVVKIIILVSR